MAKAEIHIDVTGIDEVKALIAAAKAERDKAVAELAAAELRGAEQERARLMGALRDREQWLEWWKTHPIATFDEHLNSRAADYLESVSSDTKALSASTTVCSVRIVYPDGTQSVIGEWDPTTRQYVLRPDAEMLRQWAAGVTKEGE